MDEEPHPVIYVDVDDTFVRSYGTKRIPMPAVIGHIRTLHKQGAVLYCWSSGGADYARTSAEEFGLADCFTAFLPKPDVLLDDQNVADWRRLRQVHPNECDGLLPSGGDPTEWVTPEEPEEQPADTGRLERQIAFLLEIDRLKSVLRRSYLVNDPRRENSAEHSWHLAVAAIVLAEHANAAIDQTRVLKMLLVHDVVEIDAGDTYVYAAQAGKAEAEEAAAVRLFGLLPDDQRDELRALWAEFEARETPEARFAAALDRLMPLLHNVHTQGRSWRENGITAAQVLERNAHMADGAAALWEYAEAVIREAAGKGYLTEGVEK